MKFSLTFLAVLLASAIASPVLETRNSTAVFDKRAAHVKRGAVYNTAGAVVPLQSAVAWAYDWAPYPIGTIPTGVEFVPMIWGTDANHANYWSTYVQNAINSGAKYLLGFNEPDNAGQSNLTPQQAAAAWKTYMQPYAGKLKLVSPAVTNAGAPGGLAWLDAFFKACTGCTVDAVAIHIYDSATNIAYFQNYISSVGPRYNKPVWVTEFRGSGSASDETKFINTMVPWLDNLASVQRYSYFGDLSGILISGNSLSGLGQAYANAA